MSNRDLITTQTNCTGTKGRCANYDVSCPHGKSEVDLPVRVDYRGESEFFCCVRCANELWGENSEGTRYPFPDDPSAPSEEMIRENLSYFRE